MKLFLRPVAFAFALLASFAAGALWQRSAARPTAELLQSASVIHSSASASRALVLLRLLRASHPERAADVLEDALDGDLLALGNAYQTATPAQREAAYADFTLAQARSYRQEHPHSSQSPVIAQGVSASLALAPAP